MIRSDSRQHWSERHGDAVREAEALEIDEIREIGFTGGEPLLRQQRLLDLMKRVTDSGRSVTLVTNAFWAVTPSAAERVVSRLLAAGQWSPAEWCTTDLSERVPAT